MVEINIKYRTWFKGSNFPPTCPKLEVPGWAGQKTYDNGEPWHCKSFIDGSTYGLDLIYPFDTEVTVTTTKGELIFTGDFAEEKGPEISENWTRPFSSFAPNHFGFTSSVDIQTEPGYATMILPHPRYYTDRTGSVPLPVAGIIESDFWPRVFFVVFKSPFEGQTYVFRKGEGYAQILIVPKDVKYNIIPMTEEEAKLRSNMEKILSEHAPKVASRTWRTKKGESFDNKYKILSKIAKTKGPEGVCNYLASIEENAKDNVVVKQEQARCKFKRRVI